MPGPTNPHGSDAVASEWREHWPLVMVAALGFSLHSLSSYSLGLFMEPLEQEFRWTRTQISIVTIIPGILMVLLSPSIGALVDRWGSRRIAVPSIALTGLTLGLAGAANGMIAQWMGIWLAYGVLSLGIKATVWTTAVSGVFSKGRGLALGVTLTGTALSQIAAPPLSQWLIADFGWRQAYVWLALGWTTPCFLLGFFFLFDAKDKARRADLGADLRAPVALVPGLTLGQALRNRPFQRIGASTVLTMFIGTAILIHQVPILTAGGITRHDAAWLASLAGAAGIVGKLATGWMSDRWDAATIGVISLALPAVAYWILIDASRSMPTTIAAMMIIGYTMGTKLQVSAYLTAQYAGMRNYGKIFGVITSLIAIGGGLGSVTAGAVFDKFGNYDPLLLAGIALSLVSSAFLFRMGPYPVWTDIGPSEASLSVSPRP